MADFTSHFRNQADWLERRRAETLRDLAALKEQLERVNAAPIEHRADVFDQLLRSAAACFDQLDHIERLRRGWVSATEPPAHKPRDLRSSARRHPDALERLAEFSEAA